MSEARPLNIVLFNPQIPQNTGNIARTCAATGSRLHLVKPMGFKIDDTKMKRAGLDYWNYLDVTVYDSADDFMMRNEREEMFFFSSKSVRGYTEVEYPEGCFLIFGSETKGIDEAFLKERLDRCVRLPMRENIRCLNLSNAVAIGVYEALRQQGFRQLKTAGKFAVEVNGP